MVFVMTINCEKICIQRFCKFICLSLLILGWHIERHQVQYEAVDFLLQSLSGVGGVLIDVLSQSKHGGGSHPGGLNFAATVIKEKIIDSNHVDLEVSFIICSESSGN